MTILDMASDALLYYYGACLNDSGMFRVTRSEVLVSPESIFEAWIGMIISAATTATRRTASRRFFRVLSSALYSRAPVTAKMPCFEHRRSGTEARIDYDELKFVELMIF